MTDRTLHIVRRHGPVGMRGTRTLADEMRLLPYARLTTVVRRADPESDIYAAARAEWERRQPLRERVHQAELERLAWAREHGEDFGTEIADA